MTELIERYVAAALESTPEKQRPEVGTEIRGAIDEMVSRHFEMGEPEESAERAALTELGDPARLAASYSDRQQYLIGPGWYPSYIKALKVIAGVVLPIVAVVTLLEALGADNGGMVDAIADAAGSVIWAAAMVLFWVTLGFIIAERVDGPGGLTKQGEKWSVDDLPRAVGPRQITLREVVPSVIALVAFGILALLQHPRVFELVARGASADDYDHLPVIDPDLGIGWVIGFFALLAVSVGVEVIKYVVGSWTRPVFLLVVAESALWIAFAGVLAQSERIFNPEFVRRIDETDPELWAAGGSANSIAAVVIIAITLWEVWEAWQGHRKYEQARVAANVTA